MGCSWEPMSTSIESEVKTLLLEPGYAGVLSLEEAEVIQAELIRRPSLRRRWGFKERAKSFPLTRIAAKCLPEDPKAAVASIQRQLGARRAARINCAAKTNASQIGMK